MVEWMDIIIIILVVMVAVELVVIFSIDFSTDNQTREGWVCNKDNICAPEWQANVASPAKIKEYIREEKEIYLTEEKIKTQEHINRLWDKCDMRGECDGVSIDNENALELGGNNEN